MRYTIKAKLILAFSLIIVLVSGLVIYSIKTLEVINDQSTIITVNWIPSIDCAHTVNTMTSDFRSLEYSHIIAATPQEMERLEKEITVKSEAINKEFSKYEALISNDIDRNLYNKIKAEWVKYIEVNKKLLQISSELKTDEAVALMNGESQKLFDEVSNDLLELVKFNQEGAKRASNEGDTLYAHSRTVLMTLSIIAISFSILMTVLILMSTIKPITKMKIKLHELAEKRDLTQQINIKSKDEIGQLADTMDHYADDLQKFIVIPINKIAVGDFDFELNIKDNEDELSPALKRTMESIKGLTIELSTLTGAAIMENSKVVEELKTSMELIEILL
jgi:methyl-accepting chemotaxis protein